MLERRLDAVSTLRISKMALVAAVAFTLTLVVLGNLVDPESNLVFLRHVMAMDTIEAGSSLRSRAVTDGWLQNAAFGAIVAAEATAALLCWIGATRMVLSLRAPARRFRAASAWAIAGLTLGFLVFQTGIMAIGGEWFAMWLSKDWNAQEDAFRFAVILIGVLIYVALPDPEP